jgi:galactan 5-O-arabinofuranosyltransferase
VFGAQKVLAGLPEGSFGRLGPLVTSGSVFMALMTVALFIGVNGHAREWVNGDADLVKLAHDVAQPDGRISPLSSPETRAAIAGRPSLDQLAETAQRVAARAGQSGTGVVLTDDEALLATSPFFGYIQWWELYSSPLGEYPERRAFLEQLATEPADQLASALRAEPDAPTVFVLEVDGTDVTFGSAAWDGASGSSSPWTVRLPVSAFSADDFVTTQVDGRLIAALREG